HPSALNLAENAAEAAAVAIPVTPYWPLADYDDVSGAAMLKTAVWDYFTALVRYLNARTYVADQMSAFGTAAMDKAEKRALRQRLKRELAARYPGVDLRKPPRLQIAG